MAPKGTYRIVDCHGQVLWEREDPPEEELKEAILTYDGFTLWSQYYYDA